MSYPQNSLPDIRSINGIYGNLLQNTDAEKNLIAHILLDPYKYSWILSEVSTSDIIDPVLSLVYAKIQELFLENRLNVITLSNELNYQVSFFTDLMSLAQPGSIDETVRIIKKRGCLKRILDTISEITDTIREEKEKSLDRVSEFQNKLYSVIAAADNTHQVYNLYDYTETFLDDVSRHKHERISMGYPCLDKFTSGIGNGELILIASRPSVGKTALCLNIMRKMAEIGYPTLFFSIEMNIVMVLSRILAMVSGRSISDFVKQNSYNVELINEVRSAYSNLLSKFFICDNPQIVASQVQNLILQYKRRFHIKAVFLDYIQLLTPFRKYSGKVDEVSENIRILKLIARETGLPFFVVSQLNRNVESRNDKRPVLSDLRDSGALEQEADVIYLLYREDYYSRNVSSEQVDLEVNIAKNRNGPLGTVILTFHKPSNIIEEVEEVVI